MHLHRELSSGSNEEYSRRKELIYEFWTHLYSDGDAGAATWEDLDSLRHEVTMVLSERPPNIHQAESLTARAALLISGQIEP